MSSRVWSPDQPARHETLSIALHEAGTEDLSGRRSGCRPSSESHGQMPAQRSMYDRACKVTDVQGFDT